MATNLEKAQEYMALYEQHIIRYVLGGWGQPLTTENKTMFLNNYPTNRENLTIRNGILTAPVTMLAGDCNCTIKSFFDGLVGVDDQKTPMRKPCPDIDIKAMLKQECVDVSTDMDNILIFEYVTYADKSHCGMYMGEINGKRMIAEVTYRWDNGLQLIDMDRPERKGLWGYHGKLWNFMDYTYKEKSLPNVNPSPAIDTTALHTMVDGKVLAKKGDRSDYVKEIQRNLIARGFSCGSSGADGIFGANTEKAVTNFQIYNKLKVTGYVEFDTVSRLIDK